HYTKYGKERIAEAEKRAEADLRKMERKIRCAQEEESSVYMEYRTGKILQKDYVSFKMKQAGRLEELEKQKAAVEKEKKVLDKRAAEYLAAIKALLKLKDGKEFTKDMVEAFIEKIYVYPEKRIEVLFTVTAECLEGVG
ncbi:MAG: DNA invertase, partial [Lachnospiraceae bacterium]|nr:DNA invertase [Lachnospiraceae bacterium]